MNHSGASSLLPPRSCSHLPTPVSPPPTFWFPSGYPQPQPQPPVRCSISRFLPITSKHPSTQKYLASSHCSQTLSSVLRSPDPVLPLLEGGEVSQGKAARDQACLLGAFFQLSESSLTGAQDSRDKGQKEATPPPPPRASSQCTQTVYVLLIPKVIDLITFGNFLFYFCSFYVLLGGNRVRKKRKPCQD